MNFFDNSDFDHPERKGRGANWPGSEKARYRDTDLEVSDTCVRNSLLSWSDFPCYRLLLVIFR